MVRPRAAAEAVRRYGLLAVRALVPPAASHHFTVRKARLRVQGSVGDGFDRSFHRASLRRFDDAPRHGSRCPGWSGQRPFRRLRLFSAAASPACIENANVSVKLMSQATIDPVPASRMRPVPVMDGLPVIGNLLEAWRDPIDLFH